MTQPWLKALPVLVLALAAAAAAQPAHRVADINTTQEDLTNPLYTDQNFAVLGTTVFFLEDDSVHGIELWKTDGTAAGTALVKDICPGACWGWPRTLTVWNGAVYFSADDGIHGREPWKTDGTAAGTLLVADINPGVPDSNPQFLTAGSALYLTADDGAHGNELWKTDGTAAGTVLVADIQPGPVGSNPRLWLDLGGGKLLINADDGVHGREPWITDGTPGGTALLADVNPGAGDSTVTLPPLNLENDAFALGGGAFLFTANDGVHGAEPWISDGTPGGTALFLDVNPGSADSYPHGFTRLGSTILFGATTTAGTQLWSTDGTPGGTALLKDIDPATGNGFVHGLTASGAQAFFLAIDAATGQELWKTDGTAAGTLQVKDIQPGSGYGLSRFARPLIRPFNGGVIVMADDGTHGLEPWVSDGTAAGTLLVKDIQPGTGWGADAFSDIAVVGGTAFFRGVTLDHGAEIWKTDGTAAGTVEIKDVQALASSLFVFNNATFGTLRGLGGKLLFDANDGVSGLEPWISDGTAAGTVQLADLAPGADWGGPTSNVPAGATNLLAAQDGSLWTIDGTPAGTSPLVPASTVLGSDLFAAPALGAAFFSGQTGSTSTSLWKTDGTAAGTVPLSAPNPSGFTPFGSILLFLAEGGFGQELWRTAGTGASTFALTASTVTSVQEITPLGSVALFSANVPGAGQELCETDGNSSGGTVLLKDIRAGAASSDPQQLVRLGGVVVFSAFDDATGRELYASDGTPTGTVLLKDINPGAGSSLTTDGLPPVLFGGALFFVADDGTHGRELWKTDGTAAGTVLLKDIFPGARSGDVDHLTVAGGRLFFVADDGVHGRELWSTDGTPAGTSMVADIVPGAGSPVIQSLTAIGSMVLFSADDGVHGRELWRSDGAAVGTFQIQDIAPGSAPSSPLGFTLAGSDVYFAANDGVTGFEPWSVPQSTVLTTFQDVPANYWAWSSIEAVAVAGITLGCGDGSFCPERTLTRAEMAVFLGRALHGGATVPPPPTGTRFDDVPASYWAAGWIDQIAADGVTQGCSASPPLYCPESLVSRDEMAIFLLRARHGGSYQPPPATGTRFTDVPANYWAAAWIEQLAAEGITNGCAAGQYCPERTLSRAEMAVFLARSFQLAPP